MTGMMGRFFSLDVLRGVAVLLVLFRHTDLTRKTGPGFVSALGTGLQNSGWVGVDLFFVLSGFLISNLLFNEFKQTGRLALVRFWLRRGLKIWPAYFVGYGGVFVAWCCRDAWSGGYDAVRRHLAEGWPNFVFLQNYLSCTAWQHSWSLAIEEHFYLLLPVAMIMVVWSMERAGEVGMARLKALPWVCLAVMVGALAARVHGILVHAGWHYLYYRTHCRIDGLCAGVLLGYLYFNHQDGFVGYVRRYRWLLLATSLPVIALSAWPPLGATGIIGAVRFSFLYLGFCSWVALAIAYPGAGTSERFIVVRWCALAGIYSYTIYLAHSVLPGVPGWESFRQMLMRVLSGTFTPDTVTWLDRGIFIGVSIAGGVLLSHAVERPALRWRKRLFPSVPSVAVLKA